MQKKTGFCRVLKRKVWQFTMELVEEEDEELLQFEYDCLGMEIEQYEQEIVQARNNVAKYKKDIKNLQARLKKSTQQRKKKFEFRIRRKLLLIEDTLDRIFSNEKYIKNTKEQVRKHKWPALARLNE